MFNYILVMNLLYYCKEAFDLAKQGPGRPDLFSVRFETFQTFQTFRPFFS